MAQLFDGLGFFYGLICKLIKLHKMKKSLYPLERARRHVNGFIRIEIRQQNETHRLYNIYVAYGDKAFELHSMAHESIEETESTVCRIIELNRDWLPIITRDLY